MFPRRSEPGAPLNGDNSAMGPLGYGESEIVEVKVAEVPPDQPAAPLSLATASGPGKPRYNWFLTAAGARTIAKSPVVSARRSLSAVTKASAWSATASSGKGRSSGSAAPGNLWRRIRDSDRFAPWQIGGQKMLSVVLAQTEFRITENADQLIRGLPAGQGPDSFFLPGAPPGQGIGIRYQLRNAPVSARCGRRDRRP